MPATAQELQAAIDRAAALMDDHGRPRPGRYVYRTLTPDDAPMHLCAILADQDAPAGTPRVCIYDYDTESLAQLDRAAMLAVAAREIHPPAAQTISTLRHSIAAVLRIRQEADQQAQQPAQATTAPPPAPGGSRPVLAPTAPRTDPQGPPPGISRDPDDDQDQDRARLTERRTLQAPTRPAPVPVPADFF